MVQIANHMHCWICGRAMDFDREVKACSPECQATLDERNKKRKRYMLFLYGAMAASIAFLLLNFTRV